MHKLNIFYAFIQKPYWSAAISKTDTVRNLNGRKNDDATFSK